MRESIAAALLRVALCAAVAAACGTVQPADQQQAALYDDSRRIVQAEDTTQWIVDRIHIESLAPAVMQSSCQVGEQTRQGLIEWLDARVVALGGPAEKAWRERGRDKGEIADLLELERVRGLVAYAHQQAKTDCPFWLEQDPSFGGLQGNAARLTLLLESRGQGNIAISDGDVGLGGGGGGRLLFGYGAELDLTIFSGIELGAAASFAENDAGKRELTASFAGAVPVVARFHDGASIFDIEVALAGRYNDPKDALDLGVRFALAYGLGTPRYGAFKPVGVLWIGYDYFPAQNGLEATHIIGLGTRVGINIDP